MNTQIVPSTQVVLVDSQDRPSGYMDKMEAHRQGILHRAVSVFLFNHRGDWLLQRRALSKYHSGGLWSNACCTHPYPHECPEDAAHRRLKEELDIRCPLKKSFSFIYKAQLDNELTEYEYDHVFTGYTVSLPQADPDEVWEWKYFPEELLAQHLQTHPENYTAWFRILFPELLKCQ